MGRQAVGHTQATEYQKAMLWEKGESRSRWHTVNLVREGLSQRMNAGTVDRSPSPPRRAIEAMGVAGLYTGHHKAIGSGAKGQEPMPAPHCSVHCASSCGHLPTGPPGESAPLQAQAQRTGAHGKEIYAVRVQRLHARVCL